MTATELLDMPVSEVLSTGAPAMQVFRDHGMACVGCPFAPFETVAEVAGIYGLDALELATALANAGASSLSRKDDCHDHH